jgi:hypothetical protein
MMRTNASFHADQARRFDLATRPLLTQRNSSAIIQADDME